LSENVRMKDNGNRGV